MKKLLYLLHFAVDFYTEQFSVVDSNELFHIPDDYITVKGNCQVLFSKNQNKISAYGA